MREYNSVSETMMRGDNSSIGHEPGYFHYKHA